MTYCVAITVDDGLVFVSDSRTNAGVDQLSTYSKMFRFEDYGDRVFVLLTAGNLATSQAVVSQIKRDLKQGNLPNLRSVEHMSEAAEYVGSISLGQQQKHHSAAAGSGVDTSASFILGGQIAGARAKIFMIYPEGNFISATGENPYQQIGEIKYGKPILDRIVRPETDLEAAALCALVSMDSTMRSNATVGPPIEVLIYPDNALKFDQHVIFAADDPYLMALTSNWEAALSNAFAELPKYDWSSAKPENPQ
ncbi:MAG: peptidase [Gammaproteobacteria bacterium]|nr:peptidase [Gammaproteobacteria bacterium]